MGVNLEGKYKNRILNIMKELGCNVKSIEQIHNLSYTVICEDEKYIVKFAKYKKGSNFSKNSLEKIISRKYLNTEINIYEYLNSISLKYFNTPKLIAFKRNQYIVIQYIDDITKINIAKHEKDIINALYEYNCILIEYKNLNFQSRIFNAFKRSNFKIIYFTLSKCFKFLNIKEMLKIYYIILINTMKQKKFNHPILLHKDITTIKKNIFFSNESILLIDFESTVVESRWILLDVIDLAFCDFKINGTVINHYLEKIKKGNKITEKIHLNSQIRICVLYRVLEYLSGVDDIEIETTKDYLNFFKKVLLNDDGFNSWIEENKS